MTDTFAPEPEEAIASALVARLAAVCTVPVGGALTPVLSGAVKSLSSDTYVTAAVDVASQEMDAPSPAYLFTYTATVAVRFSLADDASGNGFRDECRRVRSALAALTGDGCDALSTATFGCDSFQLTNTTTTFEGDDNPAHLKTYSATIYGRVITPTPNN